MGDFNAKHTEWLPADTTDQAGKRIKNISDSLNLTPCTAFQRYLARNSMTLRTAGNTSSWSNWRHHQVKQPRQALMPIFIPGSFTTNMPLQSTRLAELKYVISAGWDVKWKKITAFKNLGTKNMIGERCEDAQV